MITTLVTGVSGFCGRHLANRLAMGDVRVVGLDRSPAAPSEVPLDDYVGVDLQQTAHIDSVIQQIRPDCIFHLAGLVRGAEIEIYRTNLIGGLALLDAAKNHSPDSRLLMVGSAAEYGMCGVTERGLSEDDPCRPMGAYGLSKLGVTLAALDYARRFGSKVVIVRPFNLVGAGVPPSLVVGAVLQRVKKAIETQEAPAISMGNLDTQRDFLAVEDAVDAYIKLIQGNHWGEIFNICSGKPLAIRSIVQELLALAPRTVRIDTDPALVRHDDVPVAYGSCEKAQNHFAFRAATPVTEALRRAWDNEFGSAAAAHNLQQSAA